MSRGPVPPIQATPPQVLQMYINLRARAALSDPTRVRPVHFSRLQETMDLPPDVLLVKRLIEPHRGVIARTKYMQSRITPELEAQVREALLKAAGLQEDDKTDRALEEGRTGSGLHLPHRSTKKE